MLGGPVFGLGFTEDGQRFAAGGEGKDMLAKAVLTSSGTKIGDIFGPSKTVTTLDIKPKPYRMVLGGEDHEVYVFDGVPFKHAKTLTQHSNFVNRVAFSPNGKFFVTVSSDKTIVLFDSETLEVVKKIDKAHTKGIMDVNWIDDSKIATCSSDNEVKHWNIVEGDQAELVSFNPNHDGKEKLENQQLGLISTPSETLTVSLNSNINIWNHSSLSEGVRTPSLTIQGHSNYISAIASANGVLISSDQDGKVFSWSKGPTGATQASLFSGEGHTLNVALLTTFGDLVFSASSDGSIKKSIKKEEDQTFEFKATAKITGTPISISATNGHQLFVLTNNNKLFVIDVETFGVVKEVELKEYEATAMTSTISEVWVGDKKGLIHILGGEDLAQKSIIEKKHNHAVSVISASRDGSLVASGDTYRYIYVFNSESKAETGCFPYHASRIIGLDFNKANTHLLTVGLDLTVGVANLSDKTKKTIHRPNEKELTAAVFDGNEDTAFFTAGYDCSIRLWSK